MSTYKKHTYEYPRPVVTVDCVIFGFAENQLKILLTKRNIEPFRGEWALPGGFIEMNETADDCARRKLKEEAGLEGIFMEQLYTFSTIDRDPRYRVISIAYYALVRPTGYVLHAGLNIADVQWFALENAPPLAFDHEEIVDAAVKRLRGKISYQPLGFELLPEKFTLPDLRRLYETVLQRDLDRWNFRKKILKTGLLTDHSSTQKNRNQRAAILYSFNKEKYEELTRSGFYFDI